MSDDEPSEAVDFAFLEAYAAGDETLVREVLAVFCAEAAEWAGALKGETPRWRAIVHTMKGTARTIGANALGDLCERAEDDGGESLPQVRAALDGVVARIGAYLAARAG